MSIKSELREELQERQNLIAAATADAESYMAVGDHVAYRLAHAELEKLRAGKRCYYFEFFYLLKEAVDAKDQGDLTFPHCDNNVNHPPGNCTYCDGTYRLAQGSIPDLRNALFAPERDSVSIRAFRDAIGISHTGVREKGKLRCPSEFNRPVEVIHKWPGNRPTLGE